MFFEKDMFQPSFQKNLAAYVTEIVYDLSKTPAHE